LTCYHNALYVAAMFMGQKERSSS